ncbi:Uncharacterised protein [Staphylococcus aureus]|nr:Uncharacterised protein [Staphylococcus aureus]
MNCTLVNRPGEAIERLARPARPATAPATNPVIIDAIIGRFNRMATPYNAGSVMPAIIADEAAANDVCRNSLFLVLNATASETPPSDKLAPISDGITIPSLPVSAIV